MNQYQDHPIASIFPLLGKSELQDLAEDIKSTGLREDIILLDGQILDGRNRYRACQIAEVEPRFKDHADGDPLAFVVSLNLKRRHLNESQRAMVGAKLANIPHGGDRKSDQAINLAHREWGFDCPAVDIDFLMLEYDSAKPRAIVEYKNERAALNHSSHPSYKALRQLADVARIPFFAVRYTSDLAWFTATPLNDIASRYFPSGKERLSEREYVAVLYAMRDRRMPFDLLRSVEEVVAA